MLLDDLVGVIETLQQRMEKYRFVLQANETRTRMALIDPLLSALGWDTTDPGLVYPEYVASGRADYALLGPSENHVMFIEAKKLGEGLDSHRLQMLNYSNASGVEYAGLTDGNHWEMYQVFQRGTLDERRILDVTIAGKDTHQLALQLLLLWRPNLASGQPVAAGEPVFAEFGNAKMTTRKDVGSAEPEIPTPSAPSPGEGWTSLADIQTLSNEIVGPHHGLTPSLVHLPDGSEEQITAWWHILREVCEYLVGTDKLAAGECPIGNGKRRPTVYSQRQPDKVGNFHHLHRLSNGLYLVKTNTGAGLVNNAKFLLQYFGEDAGAVWLKFN